MRIFKRHKNRTGTISIRKKILTSYASRRDFVAVNTNSTDYTDSHELFVYLENITDNQCLNQIFN